MRKQRHNAPGGGQNLGRVGAVGVIAAGALCAAVLSVASRVPPTPIDTEQIPNVEVGISTEGDTTRAVRQPRRSGSSRRDGKPARDARDSTRLRARQAGKSRSRDAVRAGGSALPVAHLDPGGSAGPNYAVGPRPSGGEPHQPPSGTGPGGSSGGDGPGAQGNRGGGRQPAPGGGAGDAGGAQPRNVASAPAPAPTHPAVDEDPVDDDGDEAPAPTGTAASEDEGEDEDEGVGEGELETDPVPAAAIPAPTLVRSDDPDDHSDDE
jgi:hypothetical protein